MNQRMRLAAITGLALTFAAGSAAPVFAQDRDADRAKAKITDKRNTDGSAEIRKGVDFRSCHWLSDREVVNNSNEEIAEVSDLVLDRGSGHVKYVVVKTGRVLGMGGKAVAIPYSAFRWHPSEDKFVLASTSDQLKQYPEFSKDQWTALMEAPGEKDDDKDERYALRRNFSTDSDRSDPYAGGFDTGRTTRIDGEVKKVERIRMNEFGEQTVVTIAQKDGTTRKVALGPSWFVNSGTVAPIRGDKVTIETLGLQRDPDGMSAATSIKVGERTMRFRDAEGGPAWSNRSVQHGEKKYSTSYSRHMLASDLRGMKVDCRGEECGKVNDIIIDRNSGEVAFLSIDPNKNFLGVGDTKRLVPWSVSTVSLDNTVRIDASKEMVVASPETPSDIESLSTGSRAEMVYNAYQVAAPKFDAPRPTNARDLNANDAWSLRGPILTAIERDTTKTFSGKIVSTSDVRFDNNIPAARAITVHAGNDDEVILLGPTTYTEHQKFNWNDGDTVKIDAVRTRINGKPYWIARSVSCKNDRNVFLNEGNKPVWDKK